MNGLSLAGWAGFAVLLLATLACGVAGVRSRDRRRRLVWIGFAVFLLGLAAYRVLNLEHLLTDALRARAVEQGVYGQRRTTQAVLSSLLVVLLAASGAVFVRKARINRRQEVVAFCLFLLVCLYAARIVSLHLVDALLYARVGPLHVNWLVEGALLATIAVAAALPSRGRPSAAHRRSHRR